MDLSQDNEAAVSDGNFHGQQLMVERIIKKVFTKYSITIEVTDKIRHAFQTKLWRMGRKMAQLGGTKRRQQIDQWKKSDWSFTIDCEEMNTHLLHRKRCLEAELQNEVNKRQKMESEVSQLQNVAKEQKKTIVTLRNAGRKKGRASSKSWGEYSRQHKNRKRKILAEELKTVFEDECLTPVSIEVADESGDREFIDLDKGTFTKPQHERSTSKEELNHFALYVKDKFTLSDAAYRELSQLTSSIPRLHTLKVLSKSLNSEFNIFEAPGGVGVQQRLKPRLLVQLKALSLKPGDIVQIKLTGDGTNIGRSVHVVNIAYTILNDLTSVSSPHGNHSLAILKVPENYDSLEKSLADILKEAEELQSIEVNGHTHNIEYFLGGDMKFLALVCGIEAANGNYSCVWCKCHSKDRWDMTMDWSAFDCSKGARTISEIESLLLKPKTRRMGCSRHPLFKFIPIDHVVIDTLHLFLRIADLLINLLIQELRREDGISQAVDPDPSKHASITAYATFLKEVCKINFTWYTSRETRQLQWRDLTGPEKVRLFEKIDIPKYLPMLKNAAALQDIWKEFWRLFSELDKSYNTTFELQEDIKNWIKLFLKQYQTKNITPYAHAFAYHVPEFIEHYGSVCKFNQQGLEKLNDVTTQHYLRATNHRELEALTQVMEKRNRLEELESNGYKRTLRPRHCSICGDPSHIRTKCPSRPPLQELSLN